MANIDFKGLFGVDPTQYQQQQDALAGQQALQFAQLAPMQQAQYGIYKGAGQLGGAIGSMLGAQDPELQKATMAKQLASQFDLTTPDGMKQYAQALAQNGAADLAQMAVARSQEMEVKASEIGLKKAQAIKATMPGSKIGKMIEERDALAEKYGAEDPRVAAIDQAIYKEGYIKPPKGKGGAGGEGGAGAPSPDTGLYTPAPVGKAGAFRDAYGMVHGAAAMKDLNKDISSLKNLYSSLQNVKEEDITNAAGLVDYTQLSGTQKAIASKLDSKTVSAQSRLAALQIREQIQNLPPGPASDKDMRAAAASFPGYGDAKALDKWVKDTRITLERKLGEYQTQFGKAAGNIDIKPTVVPTSPEVTPKKRVKLD